MEQWQIEQLYCEKEPYEMKKNKRKEKCKVEK